MLIEKMNAFYIKNWDKEAVFDISQRVVRRRERQWLRKQAPRYGYPLKTWKYTYTETPFHKSQDGQSPGDLVQTTPKKKWFWIDPPADFYNDKDLPGGDRDFHLAWSRFYKELEKAAYYEPEQVLTLLHDLHCEGWTVPPEAYEEAISVLDKSRDRRVLGIKPPLTVQEVKGKERWPGAKPVWDEEWDPVLPYTYHSQANPQWTYKPQYTTDWVHDPADWADGPLPPPPMTRWEMRLKYSHQRRNIAVQKMKDERFQQLLDHEIRSVYERFCTNPESFPGDPDYFKWMEYKGERQLHGKGEDAVPILLHTDINYFIELFYPRDDIVECLFLWKYTQDHIVLRHFVHRKTGKTLLEYSQPERFAIIHALIDVKKILLFESELGKHLPHCWTDQDYIDLVGEEEYRRFLRLEGRLIDEERRRYMRLWGTEVAQEERLDQVVEMTKMKYEDDLYNHGGVYGAAVRVRDRLDRKKWTIREPSRQVQEHEKRLLETKDERRALFEDEVEKLQMEADLAYGSELYGATNKFTDHAPKQIPETLVRPES